VFQSSPGLVTGRYWELGQRIAKDDLFQSSPGLVTGRYVLEAAAWNRFFPVSILARSGDRALLLAGVLMITTQWSFNPRPVW